jgi:hypothetical protein
VGKVIRSSMLAVAVTGAVAGGWYVIVTGCGMGGSSSPAPRTAKDDSKGDGKADEAPAMARSQGPGPVRFTTTGASTKE